MLIIKRVISNPTFFFVVMRIFHILQQIRVKSQLDTLRLYSAAKSTGFFYPSSGYSRQICHQLIAQESVTVVHFYSMYPFKLTQLISKTSGVTEELCLSTEVPERSRSEAISIFPRIVFCVKQWSGLLVSLYFWSWWIVHFSIHFQFIVHCIEFERNVKNKIQQFLHGIGSLINCQKLARKNQRKWYQNEENFGTLFWDMCKQQLERTIGSVKKKNPHSRVLS